MKYRWESYVMYHGNKSLTDFWKEYYGDCPKKKVLFLLGKGFDPRMNNTLTLLLNNIKGLKLDCITFDFPDSGNQIENKKLYTDNINSLNLLQNKFGFSIKEISIDTAKSWEKRIAIMSREVADLDFSKYQDVILDVSSLPRAFYFNIAKALFIKLKDDHSKNLFFTVSENVEIDKGIETNVATDKVEALPGFKSMLSVESILDRICILIPLIGERHVELLKGIYESFKPSDMYPVLPFPSKYNPRRSDDLLQEYQQFFDEKSFNDPRSITYADEQNPFELYRIVSQMIREHKKTLKPISDNVCFGIALLTSKLLSLGGLLIGLEFNDCVAIYNVSSTDYTIDNADVLKKKNKSSEPFLLWITGEAYADS